MGIIAKNIITSTEKYLPSIICHDVSGRVFNISKVPVLNSSAKARMHRAGTRNNKIQGESSKNLSNEAYPESKMLLSGNKNKKIPFTIKKRKIAIYPVKLLKNCPNSFFQILNIIKN